MEIIRVSRGREMSLSVFQMCIRDRVAASNQRAIRAYQKAGFHYRATEIDEVPYTGQPESFWVMQAGR